MRPINLLPPEQAERAKRRRGLVFAAFLGLAFLVLLAFLTMLKMGQRDDAIDAVVAQQATNDNIQREINSLGEARQARDDYQLGQRQITGALEIDIEWGRLLNDVGRVIPDRVWLTTLRVQSGEPDPEAPVPTYGSVSLQGVAFDYPDASTWFRTLDSSEWAAVGGAWVTSVRQGAVGEFTTVTFDSSASITGAALSTRSVDRVPEIPE